MSAQVLARAAALAVSVLALAGAVGVAAAHAGAPTSVAFAEAATEAPFGSSWVTEIRVTATDASGQIGPESGVVQVSVDAIPGVWATLPLRDGGSAFLAQPADQPLLPAGSYTLRATFLPSGDLLSSAISSPSSLTITPLKASLDVEVSLRDDAVAVTTTVDGDFVTALDSVPAGEWTFDLRTRSGDTNLETLVVAQQPTDREPETSFFTTAIAPGTEYVVEWAFAPVEEIAGGLDAVTTGEAPLDVPPASILTVLAQPIAAPLPVWIAAIVMLLALATTAIVLVVRARRRASANRTDDDPPATPPAAEIEA